MNSSVFAITPTKKRLGKWKVATFDIETKPVGEESSLIAPFDMGATCIDGKKVNLYSSLCNMMIYILQNGDKYRWYCHNGGGFDFKYIVSDPDVLEFMADNGYKFELIGGNITKAIMITRGKRTILLCDSIKLMPMSLSKLCKGLQVGTSKGFIDFENGEVFDKENPEHLKYLRDDVISLYQVVTKYRQIINSEFGVEPKCTASSTAFSCFRAGLTEPIFRHNKDVSDFARLCYYGGRTETYVQGIVPDCEYIDVNSLYAFIMRDFGGIHSPYRTNRYNIGEVGFYKIYAKVPVHLQFGPLPYRKPDKTGVLFPVGTFHTFASSEEIKLALEMGCTVEIIDGYAFDQHDTDIYKPYIAKCAEMRRKDYTGALGLIAKFAQNNLYGFFGMQATRRRVIFSEIHPEDESYMPLYNDSTGEIIPNFWETEETADCMNMIPAFAAWITSCARVYLIRSMLKEIDNGNEIMYCDTDSIVLKGKVSGIESVSNHIHETDYGAFKYEGHLKIYCGIGNKTYLHIMDTQNGDKLVMKCKGIPTKHLKQEHYNKLLAGEDVSITYTQLNNLLQVIKKNEFGRDTAKRRIPNVDSLSNRIPGNKREIVEQGFAKTLPIQLNES